MKVIKDVAQCLILLQLVILIHVVEANKNSRFQFLLM